MLCIDYASPCIDAETYQKLLAMCFPLCDRVSFTRHILPYIPNKLQHELSPFLQKEIITTHWFSYITTENNPLNILLFPVNADTIAIIKDQTDALFPVSAYDNSGARNEILEDLCLFSEGRLLLGTVSHEGVCHIYPPDADFEAKLSELYPHWKKADDFDQVNLNNY